MVETLAETESWGSLNERTLSMGFREDRQSQVYWHQSPADWNNKTDMSNILYWNH